MVKFSSRKQRFRSRPAQSCTPMMPKMKKTKKQSRSTFPSMGSVSSNRFTRIRMPGRRAEEMASEKQKEQLKKLRWDGWRRERASCSKAAGTGQRASLLQCLHYAHKARKMALGPAGLPEDHGGRSRHVWSPFSGAECFQRTCTNSIHSDPLKLAILSLFMQEVQRTN